MNISETNNNSIIKKLLKKIKNNRRYYYGKPHGSGLSFLISEFRKYRTDSPIVVVTHNSLEAQQIAEEINLFYPQNNIYNLPDWETLPYDTFSPNQDLISDRIRIFYELLNNKVDILTVPVNAVINCIPPREFIAAFSFVFKKNDSINEKNFLDQLRIANYRQVTQVKNFGEFSIRGSIIDIMPMGAPNAYRLDLLDDNIDSIRTFDIETQCSTGYIDRIEILPAREFPIDDKSINFFRSKFRGYFEGNPSNYSIYKDISSSNIFPGIEYYLPLFFEKTSTIFEYLPKDSLFILLDSIDKTIDKFSKEAYERYNFLKHDIERPAIKPEDLFLGQEEFYTALNYFNHLIINSSINNDFEEINALQITEETKPTIKLSKIIENNKDYRIIICIDSKNRLELIQNTISEHLLINIKNYISIDSFIKSNDKIGTTIASINYGFKFIPYNLLVVTENDIYINTHKYKKKRHKTYHKSYKNQNNYFYNIDELVIGDPIVHQQHGVGRYKGLVSMNVEKNEIELLHIEYAKNSNLYVPISNLNLISRYIGLNPDDAPIHQLGTDQWEKKYKKAAENIYDTAVDLLEIYSNRTIKNRNNFNINQEEYNKFIEDFGFVETPDQEQAIRSVIQDMTSNKPMDRLICGDVGFGKTEVALRAAFIAASNKKQVIVLCPTTLLVEQHANTFKKRFANWPIIISELSRMRSNKEISETISGLSKGTIDIVIGTHKLLSKSIIFKNLGLAIIDEEHRFGVRQKEIFKQIRSEIDILSLTATPIPRTLSMSLEGLRDFSVITTAPQRRLPIKTFVRKQNNSIIVEAIRREISRGGQIYFLHNEIETIKNKKELIEELVPEVRIGIAHGQMLERDLEKIMQDFCQKKYDVLLCTTIIETGIDIPNANTIIINNANSFGLAQLHQLRGRVGRSYHQAYAYLLIPGEEYITGQAKKRLDAIQSMEDLGSGFYLALNDLEIRGSGEILGESQSGNIQEIGYSLYNQILSESISSIKAGKELNLDNYKNISCEINLGTPSLLPAKYCPDISARLKLYKRLSHASNDEEIFEIKNEIEDRFGKLVEQANNLIINHRLRIKANKLKIKKIVIEEDKIVLIFNDKTNIDINKIIKLIETKKNVQINKENKILIKYNKDFTSKISYLFDLMNYLE